MKSKKIYVGVAVLFVIITGSLIWWTEPYSITDIDPSEISKISIFDGNTGNSITVENSALIKRLINNFNELSLYKDKLSIGYTGYSFRITIYKVNDEVYKEFIINSSGMIRKDPFFYIDSTESIDYNFIQELLK